jgi:hypothetical protein
VVIPVFNSLSSITWKKGPTPCRRCTSCCKSTVVSHQESVWMWGDQTFCQCQRKLFQPRNERVMPMLQVAWLPVLLWPRMFFV